MIYRWMCPYCRSAYILPRQRRHKRDHWRCHSCQRVFAQPYEWGSMGGSLNDWPVAALAAPKPVNWEEIVRDYRGAYRKEIRHWDAALLYPERPLSGRPKLAAALPVQDGKLLLVRERFNRGWSLPESYIYSEESAIAAARRVVGQETGLKVDCAAYLFDHQSINRHRQVCRLVVAGAVTLREGILSGFYWWDGRQESGISDAASAIIKQAVGYGYLELSSP